MADTALNPRQRIKDILGRPINPYAGPQGQDKRKRVNELLEMVNTTRLADRFRMSFQGAETTRQPCTCSCG